MGWGRFRCPARYGLEYRCPFCFIHQRCKGTYLFSNVQVKKYDYFLQLIIFNKYLRSYLYYIYGDKEALLHQYVKIRFKTYLKTAQYIKQVKPKKINGDIFAALKYYSYLCTRKQETTIKTGHPGL